MVVSHSESRARELEHRWTVNDNRKGYDPDGMTREPLSRAADHVTTAGESIDDAAADRLTDLADQLDRLAIADRGPDHGRLARIESALHEVAEDADADVAGSIDDALDAIHDYRETLEGV